MPSLLWRAGCSYKPALVDNNQENKELDYETREIVLEQDRKRLRLMTFYYFTYDVSGITYCATLVSTVETIAVTVAIARHNLRKWKLRK